MGDVPDYQQRVTGALLGSACGDALGAAVEGASFVEVAKNYPAGLTSFQASQRGFGRYTDDTQMMIALARSLVRCGRCDAADASRAYAAEFEPWRGYGASAVIVLKDLRKGADWRTTGTAYIQGGSYGNGGAMRIAPLGLAYRHAPPGVLLQAVQDALVCTHTHHLGIDGAFVQAAAVAALCKLQPATSALAAQPGLEHGAGADTGPIPTPAGSAPAGDSGSGSSRGLHYETPSTAPSAGGGTTSSAHAVPVASSSSSDSDAWAAANSESPTTSNSCLGAHDTPTAPGCTVDTGAASPEAAEAPKPSGNLGLPAAAVALEASVSPAPLQLLHYLTGLARSEDMRCRLHTAAMAITKRCKAAGVVLWQVAGPSLSGKLTPDLLKDPGTPWSEHLRSAGWAAELAVVGQIAKPFQICATDAAAVALCALCLHWDTPEDAVVAAVHYGGDTDTIACMTGALAGALHGTAWLPDRWVSNLENGAAGRDEILRLANALSSLHCGCELD